MKDLNQQPIPKETALEICSQIVRENDGKWYRWAAWQCKGCIKWSKGDEDVLCFNSRLGRRGCNQVNSRYARISTKTN